MKKLTILLFIPLLIASCNNDKSAIEKYLKNRLGNNPKIENLKIVKTDSVYSPYDKMLSLQYCYASASSDMMAYGVKAEKASSKQEAKMYIDSVHIIYKQCEKYDSIFASCLPYVDKPTYNEDEINRKAITATYSINGREFNTMFIFDKDQNTIGHIQSDLVKIANDIDEQQSKVNHSFSLAVSTN